MTYKDWYDEAEKMDQKQKQEMIQAINTLATWNVFKREFDWTGIFSIPTILTK